jgi:dolichol-phosphate mannosyltransferase
MTEQDTWMPSKLSHRWNTRVMKKDIGTTFSRICVVIPAFKVKFHILEVIRSIGPEVQKIIVVDDECPEKSGDHVKSNSKDPRVEVIFNKTNLGVGGAVKAGYRRALELDLDIIVKVDGDGQMDTSKIEDLVFPIRIGHAEYTKGNRFFDVEAVKAMPKVRIFGNLGLSFLTKLSTGYWRIFDPNNGFTAISQKSLKSLNLEKVDNRYFFESDMLFRINLLGCKVIDVPMPAIYNNEKSSLKISRVLFEFPVKHLKNFIKRIVYSYYLRDFNLASLELPAGLILFSFGSILGLYSWVHSTLVGVPTEPGTTVLVAISFLAGLQLLLAFFNFDIGRETNGDGR